MARIRCIKPELPQSESMGRVSREARLCFMLLWTLADDEGRLRGNSRMLASLLYPYDSDASELMPSWIDDLEREGCIQPYEANGNSYVQICNWLKHQKIDHPSKSKIPAPLETSRNSREESQKVAPDLRIKDQGSRIEGSKPSHRSAPGPSPTKATNGLIDHRHQRVQQIIMAAYQEQNGIECPWDGSEGKQLQSLLKATPRWVDSQIAQCLMNLYASSGFAKGTRPREFLSKLPRYLHGPLNEFNREVKNGHARTEQARNETHAAVVAGVDKFLRGKNELGSKHVPATIAAKPGDAS